MPPTSNLYPLTSILQRHHHHWSGHLLVAHRLIESLRLTARIETRNTNPLVAAPSMDRVHDHPRQAPASMDVPISVNIAIRW